MPFTALSQDEIEQYNSGTLDLGTSQKTGFQPMDYKPISNPDRTQAALANATSLSERLNSPEFQARMKEEAAKEPLLKQAAAGFAKGAAESVLGLGQLGTRLGEWASGKLSKGIEAITGGKIKAPSEEQLTGAPIFKPETPTGQATQSILESQTPAETAGKVGEFAAEVGPGIITGAKKVMPRVWEYMSEVPKAAIELGIEKPDVLSRAQKTYGSIADITKAGREMVSEGRRTLSDSWNTGLQKLSEMYKGVNVKLPEGVPEEISAISSEYKTYMPNTDRLLNGEMNVEETSNVLKDLGKIKNNLIEKGAMRSLEQDKELNRISSLFDKVESSAVEKFGGQEGAFKQFRSTYAKDKQALDLADEVFMAKDKTAKGQEKAQKAVRTLFDEDKEGYTQAVQNLDQRLGGKLIDNILAQKFERILPEFKTESLPSSVKSTVKLITTPLSSPRMVGAQAKALGRAYREIEAVNGVAAAKAMLWNRLVQGEEGLRKFLTE